MGRPKATPKKEKGIIEKAADAINNVLHPDQGVDQAEADQASADGSTKESGDEFDEELDAPEVVSADDSDMNKHQKFDKFKN